MLKLTVLLLPVFGLAGCGPSSRTLASSQMSPAQTATAAPDDISKLSDEFNGSGRPEGWRQIYETEGWNADQLEKCAVENGWLTLVPYTSTWYMDYRGILVYKDIPGDFVVTTRLTTTGRDGRSAPRSMFSLGGIMVRSPRRDDARYWQPGGENYVFLSLGTADQPGTFQFEVKTTQRSLSKLEKIPAASGEAQLQVAKIGPHLILLRKQGGTWYVHQRYMRPDMPVQVQVGLTVYTDYPTASQLPAREHNGRVLTGGNPDLIARFDYVHYRRPVVPAGLNIGQASDPQLLSFLGETANR